MLRDYAYWRNELEWVRDRMIGLRAMLEQFQPCRNEKRLLETLPGWPLLDWVPEWKLGIPPDAAEGVSGPLNLFYIFSLQAADLERILGEPLLARRNRPRSGLDSGRLERPSGPSSGNFPNACLCRKANRTAQEATRAHPLRPTGDE
jgi:hypothetical protein